MPEVRALIRSLVMTYLGEPPTLARSLAAAERQTTPFDEIIEVQGLETESEDIADGFRVARGDRIYTTNADCYLPPDFVAKMDAWLDAGYSAACGVRLEPVLKRRLPAKPQTRMRFRLGVTGSGMAFKRELLSALPFSFKVGWDVELVMKSRAKFVVDPSVRIVHDHPSTPMHFVGKGAGYVFRMARLLGKYGGYGVI